MWKHGQQFVTDGELLDSLQAISTGTILMLDGPSGCGKTRLLKQLAQNSERLIDVYPIDTFKELIVKRLSCAVHLLPELCGRDIIAIEDIDFLRVSKSIQYEAAFVIEHTSKTHPVILTGIHLLNRLPGMIDSLKIRELNLVVWEYREYRNLFMQ